MKGNHAVSEQPKLRMRFERFYDLPPARLPAGYTIRRFRPGDESLWAGVLHASGELGDWNLERAQRALVGTSRVQGDSIHLVMAGEKAVATACVQVVDGRTREAELGWVATVPEHRGRGLGRQVCAAVLRHIEALGYPTAYLVTDDHRLPAVKTYLRLGFAPEMIHDSHPARWEALYDALHLRPKRPWRVGIVGRRGASTIAACKALPDAEVVAVCDLDETTLAHLSQQHGIAHTYTQYEAMLDSDIDAVVVATPMHLHVPHSVAALRAGKHVLSEVTAAVSLEESWELFETVYQSGLTYMLAENYCYRRPNVLVRELVRRGLFGEVYYGEGEYIHELKELNERTPWRRIWQTGRNGNTYPTHSLGPVLQWMSDRVVTVSCLGSGHHYRDPRGKSYENEDSTITLCKLARGGLVQLRLDMLSNRPHKMDYYSLQGTKGAYEAARGLGDQPKIWLQEAAGEKLEWQPLSDFESYLPANWRNPPEAALRAGHGGGDFWEVSDFVAALSGRIPSPIDVVTALEWTSAGLCSELSIARQGAPVDLPDYRAAWRAKRHLEVE